MIAHLAIGIAGRRGSETRDACVRVSAGRDRDGDRSGQQIIRPRNERRGDEEARMPDFGAFLNRPPKNSE